jgi:hypothetical protein
MVTAGVFLLIRCCPLLEMSNQALFFITIIGALTAFFAASVAVVQNDLKKVIAYSTCSQLGYRQVIFKRKGVKTMIGNKRSYFSKANATELLIDIMPEKSEYVKKFSHLNKEIKYNIKNEFKEKSVIYLWVNTLNNKTYVGRSINLPSRLDKYFNDKYLNDMSSKMPIFAALLKYGHASFDFYILEEHEGKLATDQLALREDYWVKKVNPSYNLAVILDTFVGENHPRFGMSVLQEVREKISATLTATLANKVFLQEETQNRRDGAPKKPVYCFNSETKVLEATFPGRRPMARELDINRNIVQSKVDTQSILICEYLGISRSWILRSTPIPPK